MASTCGTGRSSSTSPPPVPGSRRCRSTSCASSSRWRCRRPATTSSSGRSGLLVPAASCAGGVHRWPASSARSSSWSPRLPPWPTRPRSWGRTHLVSATGEGRRPRCRWIRRAEAHPLGDGTDAGRPAPGHADRRFGDGRRVLRHHGRPPGDRSRSRSPARRSTVSGSPTSKLASSFPTLIQEVKPQIDRRLVELGPVRADDTQRPARTGAVHQAAPTLRSAPARPRQRGARV